MRQWEDEIRAFKEEQTRHGYDEKKLEETVRSSKRACEEWRGEAGRGKRSFGRLAAAAAAVLILLPGTVYAATRWYRMSVAQDGYQAEVSVTKENDPAAGDGEEVRYYRVFWDYLPEGYSYQHGKFLQEDVAGGITPLIYALEEGGDSYTLSDVAGAEEFELDGLQGYLLRSASSLNPTDDGAYDRSLFFVWEEENIMVRLWTSRRVSDEELRKVAEGLRLEAVTAGEAEEFRSAHERLYVSTDFTWTDLEVMEQAGLEEAKNRASSVSEEAEVSLAQVLNLQEPFTYYVEAEPGEAPSPLAELHMTLKSVEVLDDISALDTNNLVDYDEVWWRKTFGENGTILPANREVYAYGDGVTEPARTFIEEKEVERCMVLVHLTLENVSNQMLREAIYPGSRMLHLANGVIREAEGTPVLTERSLMPETMEAIYVQVTGDMRTPEGYAHNWTVQAGAKQEITLGYLVDKEVLDTLCLEKQAVIVPGEAPVTVAFPIGANAAK